jgi:hypothetical protein
VVDLDTALGKEFLEVAVGGRSAGTSRDDHVGREAEADEGGPGNQSRARTAGSHADSLAGPSGHSQCNSALSTITKALGIAAPTIISLWLLVTGILLVRNGRGTDVQPAPA